MINPATVDPAALPSVALADRRSLPAEPCIYFAIDGQGVVQYIGRSVNISKRWENHHRYRALSPMQGARIAYMHVDVDLLPQVESALIEWFNPPLNGRNALRSNIPLATSALKVRITYEVEVEGLGAKIKAAREADPRPVGELAKLAGISRGYWYDLEAENVRASVPVATVTALEAVLGVDFGVRRSPPAAA